MGNQANLSETGVAGCRYTGAETLEFGKERDEMGERIYL